MGIKYCLSILIFIFHPAFTQEINNSKNNQINRPVFQVDYPFPTADKPQSKLWYMDSCWWAILPRSGGPSLWQRTENGWVEHTVINKLLAGIPGRVDVCVKDNAIISVGVAPQYLVVFRLERINDLKTQKWEVQKLATLHPPDEKESFETATITSGQNGNLWVASVAGDKVCVWYSVNGIHYWEGPVVLAEEVDEDDICSIQTVPEGVGVIWSDQVNEAVKIRVHLSEKPAKYWEKTTIIEEGNKTADDHLNTTLTHDGTLWLTTKNSVDIVGKPQFVLRVRTPQRKWVNYPFCNLDSVEHPSRPVILSVQGKPSLILNGYTVYNYKNRYLGKIVFGIIDTAKSDILRHHTSVIIPDTSNWVGTNFINDVTGPKNSYPDNVPWIILASDKDGRIYEADLAKYFDN